MPQGGDAGAAGHPQAVDGRGVHIVVLDQRQPAGGRVLIQRQHGDGRGQFGPQLIGFVGVGQVGVGVFELHHGENRIALDAVHFRVGHRQQRSPVRAVGEELALLAGHRRVDDGAVVDVVDTAGDEGAALAIGHLVTGQEERLVGQLEQVAAAVAETDLELRAHRAAGHGGGLAQVGRGHADEGCGGHGGRRTAIAAAAAARQGGGGKRAAEGQHGGAGQQFQQRAALQGRRGGCVGRTWEFAVHGFCCRSFQWGCHSPGAMEKKKHGSG